MTPVAIALILGLYVIVCVLVAYMIGAYNDDV